MEEIKSILWYLIAGTRGGITRARIIESLRKNPSNANKLSEILGLDYKTVRHHLKVLEKNSILRAIEKDKYGAVYFLSESMNANIKIFDEIWEKIGNNLGKN